MPVLDARTTERSIDYQGKPKRLAERTRRRTRPSRQLARRRRPLARARRSPRPARVHSAPVAAPRRLPEASRRYRAEAGALILAVIGAFVWAARVPETPPISIPAAPLVMVEPTSLAEQADEPAMDEALDVADDIRSRIKHAAGIVGIDSGYLVAVAARESRFDPAVHAQGTTATGLYQFTEDTWLRAVKSFGARHGLAAEAQKIASNARGDLSMADTKARARLMELRADPKLAALMAAELARDNKLRLERLLGRHVTPSETYVAHLLGVGAAARMIDAALRAPRMPAAWLLPTAAKSNPSLFKPAGHVLSVHAMLAKLKADFEREVPRSAII